MSPQEAETVLRIMAEADGGCDPCTRRLFADFIGKFPEHEPIAQRLWLDASLWPYQRTSWDYLKSLVNPGPELDDEGYRL